MESNVSDKREQKKRVVKTRRETTKSSSSRFKKPKPKLTLECVPPPTFKNKLFHSIVNRDQKRKENISDLSHHRSDVSQPLTLLVLFYFLFLFLRKLRLSWLPPIQCHFLLHASLLLPQEIKHHLREKSAGSISQIRRRLVLVLIASSTN